MNITNKDNTKTNRKVTLGHSNDDNDDDDDTDVIVVVVDDYGDNPRCRVGYLWPEVEDWN